MRRTALITGTFIALLGCAHRSDTVTTYSNGPSDENPNYQNTRSGGDSDMGSAGGESYENGRSGRTVNGTVPEAETPDYYEASKSPRDAGTRGGPDAGTY